MAPGVPQNIELTVGADRVTVMWSPVGGDPDGYVVERGDTPSSISPFAQTPASATYYNDRDLAVGTYHYAVRAIKGAEQSDRSPVRSAEVRGSAVEIPPLWFGIYVIGVVLALAVAYFLVPFPSLPQNPSTLALISGVIGGLLVRLGLMLLIVAFIPAVVEGLARTFRLWAREPVVSPRRRVPEGVTGGAGAAAAAFPLVSLVTGVISELPDMLRRPAGYGIASIVLGVTLLIGSAFGYGNQSAAADPTPTPTVSPAPRTPTPSPS